MKVTNNEIFKTLLHMTGLCKEKELILELFKLGGITASNSKVYGWRTNPDNRRFSYMSDHVLKCFFQGLFNYRDHQMKNGISVFNFMQNDCNKCVHFTLHDEITLKNCERCINNSKFEKI